MKIAFFTYTQLGLGGGLEKYFIEVTKGLITRYPELEISIVSLDEKFYAYISRPLSFYYRTKIDKAPSYREDDGTIQKLLGRVHYVKCGSLTELGNELSGYDVIYTKNELLELSILRLLRRKNLPPILLGLHTPIYFSNAVSRQEKLHNVLYLGAVYRYLVKGSAGIHVPNEDDAQLVKRRFGQLKIFKIRHPFLATDKIVKANLTPKFRIAFIGHITEQKGIGIFAEMVESLSQTDIFPQLEFMVAGSGDVKLEDMIATLSWKYKNLSYLGQVASKQVDELYQWADVVVIPSRYETVNYVALETGAHGKVAVASGVAGPREVIADGKTGYLIGLKAQNFVDQITLLYKLKQTDPEAFTEIGQNARRSIISKFEPEEIYRQLHEMFIGSGKH